MGVRVLLLAAVALHPCLGVQQSVVDIHKCRGQYLHMCHHGTSEAVQRILRAGLRQISNYETVYNCSAGILKQTPNFVVKQYIEYAHIILL